MQRRRFRLLQVQAFDRVSGLLVAVCLILGTCVGLMFAVWLTLRPEFVTGRPDITVLPKTAGTKNPPGLEYDLAEPGADELEELQKPQLQTMLEKPLTDAVSRVAAAAVPTVDQLQSSIGVGVGDRRKPGEPQVGEDAIPPFERWQIRYSTASLEEYARQLDHFGVELGAAGGGHPKVDYVSNLSARPAKIRQGPGSKEKRLYMTWAEGDLRKADRQLLSQAGIETSRRILLQFYPPRTEKLLAGLEANHCRKQGITISDVRRTVFGVKKSGDGYTFVVLDQTRR